MCGGCRFKTLSWLSLSCYLSLEVPCGPLVGLFNNKTSLVCVYTKCLLSSSAEAGWQITNIFQCWLTRGFMAKVWFGGVVNSFSSGGHLELFCTQHVKPWETMTAPTAPGSERQRWCSKCWRGYSHCQIGDFVSVIMCVVCLAPLEKTWMCRC